jgi:molecular chaperone GrpE
VSSGEKSQKKGQSTEENAHQTQDVVVDIEDVSTADSQGAVEAEQASDPALLAEALQHSRDQLLRMQAEMQNLRRRVDRDIENAHKYALESFLVELLPVVDNLERGLATLDVSLNPDDEAHQAMAEGIELTLKSFLDVLTRNKVEQVDPAGQSFDPDFHQAVTMVANPAVPANTIIDVFQKGYVLNGRLLRPAMVVVSKEVENGGQNNGEQA